MNNGTPLPNVAGQVAIDLRTAGFTIPEGNTGDVGRLDWEKTTIWFNPGHDDDAKRVAAYFQGPVVIAPTELPLSTSDVLVIIGADFVGVSAQPTGTTTSTALPTTSTTLAPASGGTTSTTTTMIGVVPETPQDVAC